MSFAELGKSDVTLARKEVSVKVGEKDLTFFANQLTLTQSVKVAAVEQSNGDHFLSWVLFSITDENGDHMTEAQARSLPDEIMAKFLNAALEVNKKPKAEAKKKAKRVR